MKTSMIVYRLFDVADEINLEQVEALWIARNASVSRLRLDRISTESAYPGRTWFARDGILRQTLYHGSQSTD